MHELCHRCHAELPHSISGGSSSDGRDEESRALFCARCGAPQLSLPDYMRYEVPGTPPTTGALPPPRPGGSTPPTSVPLQTGYRELPGQIDWRAALKGILIVSVVGGVLAVTGLAFAAASYLRFLWTISASVISLGLYAKSRPRAWMDARTGMRIGAATGLVLAVAMGIGLSATGVVMRFGTHSLGSFDAAQQKDMAQSEAMTMQWMKELAPSMLEGGNVPKATQDKLHAMMYSPEMKAGGALLQAGLTGFIILLLSAGGGAFAGMLRASQAPRPGLHRGD